MDKIKSFRLFSNNNRKSKEIEKLLKEKLLKSGLREEDSCDLAIAIGGDGSFLRMVKQTNFNKDILYVGVNAGTLGFAQEVSVSEIDGFLDDLKKGEYKIDKIGIQKTRIVTKEGRDDYYSLNEIVIRERDLNTAILNISIENVFLERFVGDGILISTSFGSTAYNLSFGGSIVYNTFHTLQITPIAPLNNRSYRNLLNSLIIPDNKKVTIVPEKKNLLVTIDGELISFDDVISLETYISDRKIKCFRRKDYDFAKKINEKFLNDC